MLSCTQSLLSNTMTAKHSPDEVEWLCDKKVFVFVPAASRLLGFKSSCASQCTPGTLDALRCSPQVPELVNDIMYAMLEAKPNDIHLHLAKYAVAVARRFIHIEKLM